MGCVFDVGVCGCVGECWGEVGGGGVLCVVVWVVLCVVFEVV